MIQLHVCPPARSFLGPSERIDRYSSATRVSQAPCREGSPYTSCIRALSNGFKSALQHTVGKLVQAGPRYFLATDEADSSDDPTD